MDGVDQTIFLKLLRLACGNVGLAAESTEELLEVGGLAQYLRMEAIATVLANLLMTQLTSHCCPEMLANCKATCLRNPQTECCNILEDLQEIAQTVNFFSFGLGEEATSDMLEDDDLSDDSPPPLDMSLDMPPLPIEGHLKELAGDAMATNGVDVQIVPPKAAAAPVVDISAGTVFGADIFMNPLCVALDAEGRVLVSDRELHQIILFGPGGGVVRRFGSHGTGGGRFKWPVGVAVDPKGRIVVGDFGNHRIQVLNADGSVARCFGHEGSRLGQLKHPCGVAVDKEGRIIVADRFNDRVQIFSAEGSLLRCLGSRGAAVGQLDGPVGVAVDGAGRVVVADCNNHRVQVFSADGTVALCFGARGGGLGQLSYPRGVAVDGEGRFVVADCNNHRVQVFNSDGSAARIVGEEGTGVGQLKSPYGVAVDGAGRILVVEQGGSGGNLRVQVF